MSDGNGATFKPAHVFIAMPCGDDMKSATAYDLARLVAFTDTFGYSEANQGILAGHYAEMIYGTLLPEQRRSAVHQAMSDERITHILWIDSDMRFPKDGLIRLLGRRKKVVAASYPTRRLPVRPTAFKTITRGDHVYTEPQATGCAPVAAVGMGFMLTAIDVFRLTAPPWFTMDWTGTGFEGEDITFARRCEAAGIPLWVDHDLTKEVRHIGVREVSNEMCLLNRDLAAKADAENARAEESCAAIERSLTLVTP